VPPAAPLAGLRVVLVAKFNRRYHLVGRSLARALAGLGAEVARVELRDLGLARLLGRDLGRRLRAAIRRLRPDLVLSYKGAELGPDLIAALRPASGARWVNWFPDSPHQLEVSLRNGAAYDRCFLFDSYMVERHRALGRPAEFLALGYDPEVFRPLPGAGGPPLPIVFVGSPEPLRDRALERIADLGLALFGPGRAGGPRFGDDLVRLYARSEIALNVHQFFGEEPGLGRYGTGANQRVFELAGIGRVQLCDAKADIARSFEPDREIVLFRSGDELRERAIALLRDPGLRERIGGAALRRAGAEHTWRHRVRELAERVFR
jgi:spore maturation protein CgeB